VKIRLTLFLLATCICAYAQKSFLLEVNENGSASVLRKFNYSHKFTSAKERDREVLKILYTLYDNAYLTARIDSVTGDSATRSAYFTPGEKYEWAYLKKGNADEGMLGAIGFREKLYRNKPVYYKDIRQLNERILRWYENNGYPFASVRFDSVGIGSNSISATLHVEKNILVKMDSVLLKGKGGISPVYIYNYIGIKPGDLYNESKVRVISNRLRELPFLRETRPFEVQFTEKMTKLILYPERKKASQFDGVLGILPDNNTGKVVFTGDVHLKLQNPFAHGELMELNWRRLQTQTQDLRTHLVLPFLFRTPFGADAAFKLYKKDTTFLEVNPNLGIQYVLSGGNYLKVFVNQKRSSLLSTKGLEFITVLPPYADITTTLYGIGYHSEKLDYRLNPRKGYAGGITLSAGNKHIIENPKLNPLVYKDIKLVTAQYTAEADLSYYVPLFRKSTLRTAFNGGILQSDNIFENELFRFGGFRTLRGFDEESLHASAYGILTLEYRYLLEQNSYLYFFGDGAWYEKNTVEGYIHDMPFGFGSGISFETKAGIFSIGYALGKQFNNPIYLKSGKVHFGIVSYF
jgi:outer membrane protein assembly factor BamA